MYKKLVGLMLEARSITDDQRKVLKHIWKCPAPSKVIAFLWKLLHDRIPTKVNLFNRHALLPESSLVCVFCEECLETSNHLFIHCGYTKGVWDGVFNWL